MQQDTINTRLYVENYLMIVNKKGELIPFVFNTPQQRLYELIKQQAQLGKPIRIIILKARQLGFSTLIEGVGFKKISTKHNLKMAIVTHKDEATRNLYTMTKRFYENLIPELKPQIKSYNGYGIEYDDLKSSVVLYTAGSSGIGRSATIQILHASEVAFWPGDVSATLDGLLQAVPDNEESMIFLESTPNGFNKFKDIWDGAVSGENGFIPFFAAWFELDEYQSDDRDFIINEDVDKYGNEQELKDLYNLTNRQLAWRRNTIKTKLGGDLKKFKQEYPSNPLEAFISSGDSVFDNERVINRMEHVRQHVKPIKIGYFKYETYVSSDGVVMINNDSIRWIDDVAGSIKIYEEPVNIIEGFVTKKAPYAIGGDTAGTGEDYFTAKVINNMTKADAAVYREQYVDEGLYAEQVYCLHWYYHRAYIGIEVNYSIYPTRRLMELKAPQYTRENIDTVNKVTLDSLGFKTTAITRPVIVEEFKDTIREDISIIKDMTTLEEMLTFVKNDKGKAEAVDGKHDDMIMATMIAHRVGTQQRASWIIVKTEEIDVVGEFFGKSKKSKKVGINEW